MVVSTKNALEPLTGKRFWEINEIIKHENVEFFKSLILLYKVVGFFYLNLKISITTELIELSIFGKLRFHDGFRLFHFQI